MLGELQRLHQSSTEAVNMPKKGQKVNTALRGAGLVLAGAAASVSLLLRHWRAIEAWSAEPAAGAGGGDAAEPLLWQASRLYLCLPHSL